MKRYFLICTALLFGLLSCAQTDRLNSILQSVKDKEGQHQKTVTTPAKTTTSKNVPEGYVDLGLPSGTLWEEWPIGESMVSYDKVDAKYWKNIPTKEQWEELLETCEWYYKSSTMIVCTGPNGNSVSFSVGEQIGEYWSSTPYHGENYEYMYVLLISKIRMFPPLGMSVLRPHNAAHLRLVK